MSSWRYQVMRHIADDGEPFLAVHEFYVMHDKKEGWTARPITIEADSLQDLRKALLRMLIDLEDHGIRDAKTGAVIDG
jgi:hypothetical protein